MHRLYLYFQDKMYKKQFKSPPLFYKDSNSQIGVSVNLPEAATLQCKALNQPLFSRDLQFRIGKFPNGYSNSELCNSILNKISFNWKKLLHIQRTIKQHWSLPLHVRIIILLTWLTEEQFGSYFLLSRSYKLHHCS